MKNHTKKDIQLTFSADMKVSEQCGIAASKGNQIKFLAKEEAREGNYRV